MLVALRKKVLISSFLISVIYFLVNFYFTNPSLINQTILGSYELSYKIKLVWELFLGLGMSLGEMKLDLLILISLMTGLNLALIISSWRGFKFGSNLATGGTFLGFTSSSCAACGVPLIGVLGGSGSLTKLPFQGLEMSFVAVFLLGVSLFFLLKNYSRSCKLDSRYGI